MNKNREVPVRIIIRKKGHAGAAHHGGAWKVALADFMTAMFALFLVLWLVNQSSDIKSAIAGYFQDPLGTAKEFGSSIMPGEGAQAASVRPLVQPDPLSLRRDRLRLVAKQINDRVEETPELAKLRSHIEIKMTEDGLRIELLEDSTGVFFDTGRPAPNANGKKILGLLGAELASIPNRIRIEGHTDAWPYRGSPSYTNWELSADRANAARKIMVDNGLHLSQILQIIGYAEREPRDADNPFSPSNRRITITLLLNNGAMPDSDAAGSTAVHEADRPAAVADEERGSGEDPLNGRPATEAEPREGGVR
jgi:chemotaxis protein MotB